MAGRDLLTEARAFVDMHDRLVDRASEKQLTGSVWLGIAEGCFVDLIPELLERVQRVYTALELNVLCENNSLLQRKIEEGVLDLAVVMSLEKLPSAMQLSRPRLQWVASPDFAIHDWRVLPLACYPDDRLLGAAAKHASAVPQRCLSGSDLQRQRTGHCERCLVRNGGHRHGRGLDPRRIAGRLHCAGSAAAGAGPHSALAAVGPTIRGSAGREAANRQPVSGLLTLIGSPSGICRPRRRRLWRGVPVSARGASECCRARGGRGRRGRRRVPAATGRACPAPPCRR